jgi:CheY-like chemotaxis protein
LVGLLGGEIKINSTLGQGSEFYFDLNLAYSKGSDTIVAVRPDQLSRESYTIISNSAILPNIIQQYLNNSSLHEVRVKFKTIDEFAQNVPMLSGFVFYDLGYGLTEEARISIESLVGPHTKVIVLASMFDLQVREELMSLGVKGVLFKPFIDSDLGLILRQAFRTKEEVLQQELETSDLSVATQALKIVVVDDIQINRLVAQRLLEQGGHEVVCFESGQAILHHLRNGSEFNWRKSMPACECDLILMDVQMPGMDGLETTQLIRQWEAENEVLKSVHIPIVALTAHALKGDKERFIESGMDDALRKPIDSDALTLLLKRITLELNAENGTEVLLPKESVVVFDMQQMLTRFNNDMSLVKEIALAYLEEAEELSLNLDNALQSEDHDKIRMAAHALRGSLLNVCASASSEVVSKLESFASEKKGGYNELAVQLRKECGILKLELERVLA